MDYYFFKFDYKFKIIKLNIVQILSVLILCISISNLVDLEKKTKFWINSTVEFFLVILT